MWLNRARGVMRANMLRIRLVSQVLKTGIFMQADQLHRLTCSAVR